MITIERKPKRGRPSKPYRTSSGELINGLRRRTDGRWQLSNGKVFTCHDEGKAVIIAHGSRASKPCGPIYEPQILVQEANGLIPPPETLPENTPGPAISIP